MAPRLFSHVWTTLQFHSLWRGDQDTRTNYITIRADWFELSFPVQFSSTFVSSVTPLASYHRSHRFKTCIHYVRLASQPASAHFDTLNVSSRSLRSSEQQLLQVPRCSTVFFRRAFIHCAPRFWNNLPPRLSFPRQSVVSSDSFNLSSSLLMLKFTTRPPNDG